MDILKCYRLAMKRFHIKFRGEFGSVVSKDTNVSGNSSWLSVFGFSIVNFMASFKLFEIILGW